MAEIKNYDLMTSIHRRTSVQHDLSDRDDSRKAGS